MVGFYPRMIGKALMSLVEDYHIKLQRFSLSGNSLEGFGLGPLGQLVDLFELVVVEEEDAVLPVPHSFDRGPPCGEDAQGGEDQDSLFLFGVHLEDGFPG